MADAASGAVVFRVDAWIYREDIDEETEHFQMLRDYLDVWASAYVVDDGFHCDWASPDSPATPPKPEVLSAILQVPRTPGGVNMEDPSIVLLAKLRWPSDDEFSNDRSQPTGSALEAVLAS